MSSSKYLKALNDSSSRSDALVRMLFLFLVVVIPLAFSRVTFNGYDLPKVSMLRFLTILLLGTAAAEAISSGWYRWRRTVLDLPIAALLLIVLISTLFSVDFLTSLFGQYSRQEGFITSLNYFLIFFLAMNYLADEKWKVRIFTIWFATASLIAFYGILQHFGLDPLTYSDLPPFELERSFSTLGNPIRLASYLVLTFPLALSCFLASRRAYWGLPLLALALSLLSILLTYSRGGWIGLLSSVFIFLVLTRGFSLAGRKRLIITLVAVVLLTIAVVLVPYGLREYSVGKRLLSTVAIGGGSAAGRLEAYKAALRGIVDRPFLGYGLGTFRYVYQKHRSFRAVTLERDVVYERPHSDLLQVASDEGMTGLLMYLWVVVAILLKGWALTRQQKDFDQRVLTAGELAGIGGYLVAIQFSFGGIAETTMFWVLVGLLLARGSNAQHYELSFRSLRDKAYLRVLAYVFAVFFSIGALAWTSRPLMADHYFFQGEGYQSRGKLDEAIGMYKKAITLNPLEAFYRQYLATAYHSKAVSAQRSEQASRWLGEAESESLNALNLSSLDVDSRLELLRLSVLSGTLTRAADYGEQVLELDPYSYDAHKDLALVYFTEGDVSRAISHLKMVKKIDPQNVRFRYLLAKSYEKQGRKRAAILEYQQILKMDPGNSTVQADLQKLLEGSE